MSYQNAVNNGDFNLNLVSIRKPLEFADGTIQDTAYTGATGVPTLAEVLTAGDDGNGNEINNISQLNAISSVGQSITPIVSLTETIGAKSLSVNLNSVNDYSNPMVNAGDLTIVGSGGNLNLTTSSANNVGVKMNTTVCTVQAGSTTDTPTCYVQANGPNSRVDVKGDLNILAGYRNKYNNNDERIGVTAPALSTAVVPSFEFKTVRLTGNAANAGGTISLSSNISGTTDYMVFPSIYYGYTGSAGTYNATGTSANVRPVVITQITATQFNWVLDKNTGDNVQIDINFLIVYNMVGTDTAKTWS